MQYEKFEKRETRHTYKGEDFTALLKSQGAKYWNGAQIWIKGAAYLPDTQQGLGIVVYNKKEKKIVDAVTFDIGNGGNESFRR